MQKRLLVYPEPAYYQNAYELLDALAYWFFEGECPWIDEEKGWAELQGHT